jgi:hypothetical protein
MDCSSWPPTSHVLVNRNAPSGAYPRVAGDPSHHAKIPDLRAHRGWQCWPLPLSYRNHDDMIMIRMETRPPRWRTTRSYDTYKRNIVVPIASVPKLLTDRSNSMETLLDRPVILPHSTMCVAVLVFYVHASYLL